MSPTAGPTPDRAANRKRRFTLVSAAVTLATTLLVGIDRIDTGKVRLGATMVAGALVGATVLAVRLRALRKGRDGT